MLCCVALVRQTLLVTAEVPSAPIQVTQMTVAIRSSETSVLTTSQNMVYFKVTAVKTSNVTSHLPVVSVAEM
jgi:hypothetical protein